MRNTSMKPPEVEGPYRGDEKSRPQQPWGFLSYEETLPGAKIGAPNIYNNLMGIESGISPTTSDRNIHSSEN